MVWKLCMQHYCQKMVIIMTSFEYTLQYNNIINKVLTDLFVYN